MPVTEKATGLRIESALVARQYVLPPSRGGSAFKSVSYYIKVVWAADSTDDLTLKIEHSPDGNLWATHTDFPSLADVGELMAFDSDADVVLGEHFRAVIKTAAALSEEFLVDVFEVTRTY